MAQNVTDSGARAPRQRPDGRSLSRPRVGTRYTVLALAALAACGDQEAPVAPDPPRPENISISPASAQLSYVGETVRFSASVTDQYGAAFAGSVTWSSSAPQVFGVSADGVATAVANGSGTVTASLQGASATASVTVEQIPAAMTALSGNDQEGRASKPLPEPLSVLVQDAGDVPVANVVVAFTAADASGDVTPSTVPTDASGKATTTWTLGTAYGTQSVVASIDQGASAVFTATALTPEESVDSIAVVAGDGQEAAIKTTLPTNVVIRALDVQDLPVEGVEISFGLAMGHGSVTPASATTDAAGLASTTWTLGDTAGVVTLTASVVGSDAQIEITARSKSGLGICDRTPQVQDAIMGPHGHCADITEDQLRYVTGLDFRDSPVITSLWEDDFAGLHSVTWLYLQEHKIEELPEGVFRELTSLETLLLHENRLSSLPEGVFRGLANLQTLLLGGNRLSGLPADVFADLSSLETLVLSDNELESLSEPALVGLGSLEKLSLQINHLRTVDPNAFADLRNLRELRLGANPLVELPPQAFSGLANLEHLELDYTALSELPSGVFSTLSELRYLNLEGNDDLTVLPSGLFLGLSKLEVLSLRSRANYLPPDLLTGLNDLARLSLSGSFAEIPSNLLVGLYDLVDFRLSGSFSTIPSGLLSGLTRLQRLSLHGRFLDIPDGLFSDLSALTELWLGGSRLPAIPEEVLKLGGLRELSLSVDSKGLSAGAFVGLSHLETLRIAGGTRPLPGEFVSGVFEGLSSVVELWIEAYGELTLSPESFRGLDGLEKLRLFGTELSRVPERAFVEAPNLRVLQLYINEIVELSPGAFSELHKLEELNLTDNPGAPFPITLSLERTDTTDLSVAGPATVVVRVAEAAPFDMAVRMSASGGTMSSGTATIATGETQSMPFTVTQRGSGAVVVRFETTPSLPNTLCPKRVSWSPPHYPCYQGIVVTTGGPITLFR